MRASPPRLSSTLALSLLGNATLGAYRASDGRLLWQTPPDAGDGFQWLAASQGMLFAASFHSKVAAFRAFDGSQVWEYQTDAPQIFALQAKSGSVYAATYDSSSRVRSVFALRSVDGV